MFHRLDLAGRRYGPEVGQPGAYETPEEFELRIAKVDEDGFDSVEQTLLRAMPQLRREEAEARQTEVMERPSVQVRAPLGPPPWPRPREGG